MKKLTTDDKLMQYKWLDDHIVEASKRAIWINDAAIYKNTLKFNTKFWWSIVRHCIASAANNNTLGAANKA